MEYTSSTMCELSLSENGYAPDFDVENDVSNFKPIGFGTPPFSDKPNFTIRGIRTESPVEQTEHLRQEGELVILLA